MTQNNDHTKFVSYYKCACEELPNYIKFVSNPVERKLYDYYSLVVVARFKDDLDWNGQFRAMYAKLTKIGHSTSKPLIAADGCTIEEALGNLWYQYTEKKLNGQIANNEFFKEYFDKKTSANTVPLI